MTEPSEPTRYKLKLCNGNYWDGQGQTKCSARLVERSDGYWVSYKSLRAAVEAERERLGVTNAEAEPSGNHVPGCKCRSCGYWRKHLSLTHRAHAARIESIQAYAKLAEEIFLEDGCREDEAITLLRCIQTGSGVLKLPSAAAIRGSEDD